jgi:transcription-repair coupling factor (superfamily II helicase)
VNKQKINRYLPSADALAISKLYKSQLLVIANDAYTANRLLDEIQLFAPQLRVKIFPDTEILPYERISTQKDIIAERLSVLWQISHNALDIVIVQLSTLQTKICPVAYLHARVMLLKIGDKLSIERLSHQLVNSDYTHVAQVYEAGEFAIRGGIIDIMPMGSKHIIRIELFDDEIETLKLIDHKTKLLIEEIDKFELIPAREYPTDKESLKLFINNFTNAFPKDEIILKELKNGIYPAGSEFYLPLFFAETATLFDYIDTSWHIVYFQNLVTTANLNWQEIGKRHSLLSYQYPCLKPIDLFITPDTLFTNIKSYTAYELQESGELNAKIKVLPDISTTTTTAFIKLKEFRQTFKGKIICVLDSIGRVEIMRQTLLGHGFNIQVIDNLNAILDNKTIYIISNTLYNGFIWDDTAFITEQELYKNTTRATRTRKSQTTSVENDAIIRDLAEIKIGDFVVHINHGIGKYVGLTRQTIADIEYEMLELEYQGESRLFIPVSNLHLISRYSHLENVNITPNQLGSSQWGKIKTKAEKKINDMAAELLELYAKREMEQGNKFILPPEYADFAASFMYEPTPDQINCIDNIITDMTRSKPMDRLICGDVGFGKTEVAIRAAFICAMNGKQVAMLAPTTLLTEQHFQNFVNRFAGLPIKIAEISRFKTKTEINETLELVKQGQIDIVIGTHRLIQSDIQFANLGLVIIDEEHRFGVKQKEKLKQLRSHIDFLAMTATPIPRSLSMAMEGLRDFSIIATPPKRRLAVNTLICTDEDETIRNAIYREIKRGGQVYFLFNDVANITKMHERLSKLVPEVEIAIAHGQMHENILEQSIRDFVHQRYHILLCSTIIESGIDIANANTIIIYRADKLGLAQLHQLRGRVGRSHHQAYCYLVIPENITPDAEKRLDAIKMTSELGSGFNLAMHDLEIRGAGEILGENQSGDIKEVGLSLYTEMLKRAINKLKSKKLAGSLPEISCEVNLNTTSIIPEAYCPDIHERLVYYKRLAKANNNTAVDLVYQDIMDKWGLPPNELQHLVETHHLRVKAVAIGVQKFDIYDKKLIISFIDKPPIKPESIIALLQKMYTCKFDGKNKLIWNVESPNINDKVKNAHYILEQLC